VNRNRTAQAITVAVLALALGIGIARKKPAPELQDAPQDTIYAMLNAARSGDVKTYLANYTEPMEAALRQSIAESTEPAFAKYLQDSQSAIRGVAVSEPEITNGTEAKVRVEYVYQDRNEVQIMYLARIAGAWKIARTEGDQRIKTLIPYGTPFK
jgi:biotin-(acetyl-CoA carboxylase) ligase